MPYDRYLVMVLKVLKRWPLADEAMPGIVVVPRVEGRRRKGEVRVRAVEVVEEWFDEGETYSVVPAGAEGEGGEKEEEAGEGKEPAADADADAAEKAKGTGKKIKHLPSPKSRTSTPRSSSSSTPTPSRAFPHSPGQCTRRTLQQSARTHSTTYSHALRCRRAATSHWRIG